MVPQPKLTACKGEAFYLSNSFPHITLRKVFLNFNELPQGKPTFRVINYNRILFRPRAVANHLEGTDISKMTMTGLFANFLHCFYINENLESNSKAQCFVLKGNLF